MPVARTTILIQDDLLLEVRRVAQTRGVTLTEVIGNALKTYVESQPHAGLPSFTAAGRSRGPGSGKVARNTRKLVGRSVDPYEGSAREGGR